jgi:hypothetical protein
MGIVNTGGELGRDIERVWTVTCNAAVKAVAPAASPLASVRSTELTASGAKRPAVQQFSQLPINRLSGRTSGDESASHSVGWGDVAVS